MYVFGVFYLHYVHVENDFSTADISGKLTPKQSRCRPQKKSTCADSLTAQLPQCCHIWDLEELTCSTILSTKWFSSSLQ